MSASTKADRQADKRQGRAALAKATRQAEAPARQRRAVSPVVSANVFDLDAFLDEAREVPFEFKFAGREWSLAPIKTVDFRLIEQADSGDIASIRAVLEEGLAGQWTEFEQQSLGVDALLALFERWLAHSGLGLGESQASAALSANTAAPSRPTSPKPAARSRKSSPAKSRRAG